MTQSKKKILVVTDIVPPDSSQAGAPRIFELCNALKSKYDFHLFLISSDESEFRLTTLESVFSSITCEYFDAEIKSFPKKMFRRFSPTASFDYRFTHKNNLHVIRQKIASYVDENSCEAIFITSLRASQFVPTALLNKSVLDFCDSLSKLFSRYVFAKDTIRNKISNALSSIGLFFWERSVATKVSSSTLVSPDDLGTFSKLGKKTPIVVPLGIQTKYFQTSAPLPSNKSLMFFGTMNYLPNTDAALWLAHEIFPIIKSEHPDATLEIIGANPPHAILQLEQKEGISIHANVNDIRPYIERNAVCLTPLRLGAGVKNKILVAMSMERPVISTSMALEGLQNTIKKQALTADDPEETAKKVNQVFALLSSEETRQKFSNKLKLIRQEVQAVYSWEQCAKPLAELFDKIIEDKTKTHEN